MSVVHPSPRKVEDLQLRWEGQEHRLEAVARDLRAGRDWTVHLQGLPYVEEVPPLPGEACGRDLRGSLTEPLTVSEARETPRGSIRFPQRILAFAFFLVGFHFLFFGYELLDPITRSPRELVLVTTLLVLGILAVFGFGADLLLKKVQRLLCPWYAPVKN